MTAPIYYFGCIDRPGHYLWEPGPRRPKDPTPFDTPGFPGAKLDMNYAPKDGNQPPALIGRHCVDGWTVISFWDRSVDERRNSNSSFIAPGEHSTEEMIALAKQHFPEVIGRVNRWLQTGDWGVTPVF